MHVYTDDAQKAIILTGCGHHCSSQRATEINVYLLEVPDLTRHVNVH